MYHPPNTNRGVENTKESTSMPVKTNATDNLIATFDWIEFTVQDIDFDSLFSDVLHLFKSDFTELNKGRFGYNAQLKWANGNVFVLYNADDEGPIPVDRMGFHVMITGTGCRCYETTNSIHELLIMLVALGDKSKFSRIDLAIDDKEDRIINFSRIHKAALNSEFTSRWNKWDELNSRECASGSYLGRTMYFGSQSSEIFCRIYDKTLERQANAKEDETIPDCWTRMELVYKKERAKLLALYLVENNDVGRVLRESLNNYIRFVKQPLKSHDTNKSRWPSAKWWVVLLGEVGVLKLTIKRQERTIDDMEHWLDTQIAPTIAAIMTAKDGESDWLHKIISDGAARLKQKHKDAIQQYKQN